jgi:hypothetical protein
MRKGSGMNSSSFEMSSYNVYCECRFQFLSSPI